MKQDAEFTDIPPPTEENPQPVALVARAPEAMAPEVKAQTEIISYEGIGTMVLSDEENAILCAPADPHKVFLKPASNGVELAYIPQVEYRNRFKEARVPYSLRIINTRTRSIEMQTKNGVKPVEQVYVHAQLWVKGKFISEAIGEDNYYLDNQNDSYATAWEKAKSNALVRCCKDLGMFSELWDKTWNAQNKQHFKKANQPTAPTQPQRPPPVVKPVVTPPVKPEPTTVPTPQNPDADRLSTQRKAAFTKWCKDHKAKMPLDVWINILKGFSITTEQSIWQVSECTKFCKEVEKVLELRATVNPSVLNPPPLPPGMPENDPQQGSLVL